jgi:nucleobase:cation symporter-1, NCS1 family
VTTVLERDVSADWGIEPVPRDQRKLSGLDVAVLWGDLGIGLLVLVTGALLVPGLGFGSAAVAVVLGSLIGVSLLATAAAAGAQHGLPTMVLLRPVLGIRGSWAPTALNVVQLVGWTAVELWAMSYVADVVSAQVFGFSARYVWLAAAAVICTALALWGPVRVTRVWMERFGLWVIGSIVVAATIALLLADGIGESLRSPGDGSLAFGAALDLVIAMPVSWFPLVADYTRFGARPRSALFGTFWGYLIANVWLYLLGALLVLNAGAEPSPAGIAVGVLSLAGGTLVGVLFLVGLLVGETDEAFANIYSGAVSLRNVWPKIPQRLLVVLVAVLGAALAAVLTMELYESFLFLIGSVFVPLLGILLADHFIRRRGRIAIDDLYREGGRYWFTDGVRWSAFVPWLAGFVTYHWINPSPLGWWLDLNQDVFGAPLVSRFGWLSASIPAFLVAGALGLFLRRDLSSARPQPERQR